MLPDLFCKNLKLVICGTAPGETSAQRQQYYAKSGNKFWLTLHLVGLTPVQLFPAEYARLLDYGIGLTDLVKGKAGMDRILKKGDFKSRDMVNKIMQYQPDCFCFNGKRADEAFFNVDDPITYGLQKGSIGKTHFFVAPSTSGAANKWWNIDLWKELAAFVKERAA